MDTSQFCTCGPNGPGFTEQGLVFYQEDCPVHAHLMVKKTRVEPEIVDESFSDDTTPVIECRSLEEVDIDDLRARWDTLCRGLAPDAVMPIFKPQFYELLADTIDYLLTKHRHV